MNRIFFCFVLTSKHLLILFCYNCQLLIIIFFNGVNHIKKKNQLFISQVSKLFPMINFLFLTVSGDDVSLP